MYPCKCRHAKQVVNQKAIAALPSLPYVKLHRALTVRHSICQTYRNPQKAKNAKERRREPCVSNDNKQQHQIMTAGTATSVNGDEELGHIRFRKEGVSQEVPSSSLEYVSNTC